MLLKLVHLNQLYQSSGNKLLLLLALSYIYLFDIYVLDTRRHPDNMWSVIHNHISYAEHFYS